MRGVRRLRRLWRLRDVRSDARCDNRRFSSGSLDHFGLAGPVGLRIARGIMANGSLESLFPRLCPSVERLHCTPRHGVLRRRVNQGQSGYTVHQMNRTAAKILSLCDGSRNIAEIIANLVSEAGGNIEAESVRLDVTGFLVRAQQEGLVSLSVTRGLENTCRLRVTGSFDYFVPYHISI